MNKIISEQIESDLTLQYFRLQQNTWNTFRFVTVLLLKMQVFGDVTSYYMVTFYRRFEALVFNVKQPKKCLLWLRQSKKFLLALLGPAILQTSVTM
jgi:hypothetical protein